MLIITSIQYAIGQCLKIPVLNIATLVSHKNFGEMVYTTFVFIMNLGFTFSCVYIEQKKTWILIRIKINIEK